MDRASFSKTEKTMRIWLEHDPVAAVALLLVGLATVELLAFII
jgi:hypothetical protein